MRRELYIEADADALSRAAANEWVRAANAAVQAKGMFTVALSGGTTPQRLYSLLVDEATLRAAVPWDKTRVFWGDERHVPPDHADSNYRMANEAMLSKAPIASTRVHRIKSELADASRAANEYEQTLRECFNLVPGQFPRFDLVLLGLGPDGHTASLFPDTAALQERRRLVVANWVEKFASYRLTLTLPVLNNAACVIFLVSGEEKAQTLGAVLEEEAPSAPLPAQLIRPTQGRLVWLVDRAAARLLSTNQR
jgi:6-phosphogluconolactonase